MKETKIQISYFLCIIKQQEHTWFLTWLKM
jgi:hypothetical protein